MNDAVAISSYLTAQASAFWDLPGSDATQATTQQRRMLDSSNTSSATYRLHAYHMVHVRLHFFHLFCLATQVMMHTPATAHVDTNASLTSTCECAASLTLHSFAT
jgi:hypothetical protein